MQEPTNAQSIADPSLLSERAYAALRDRLVTLEIPPGAPIDEEALTRELEVRAAKGGRGLYPEAIALVVAGKISPSFRRKSCTSCSR